MKISIPTEQFKRIPPYYRAGWTKVFLREVARVMILDDRVKLSYTEPTKQNILRAVEASITVGAVMERLSNIDSTIIGKNFPKMFETLVSDEAFRLLDEEKLNTGK